MNNLLKTPVLTCWGFTLMILCYFLGKMVFMTSLDIYGHLWRVFDPVLQVHSDHPVCAHGMKWRFGASAIHNTLDVACFDPVCGGLLDQGSRTVFIGPLWQAENSNISVLSDLPSTCRTIYTTDVVDASTAHECGSFCDLALNKTSHWLMSPYCSARVGGGPALLHTVCGKVQTFRIFGSMRSWKPYAIASAFSALGASFVKFGPSDIHNAYSLVGAFSNRVPPSQTDCLPEGPHPDYKHAMPFCCLNCKSDAEGARWSLGFNGFVTVLDPFLDVASSISYLAHGQPTYGFISAASFLYRMDPLQIKTYTALASAWHQGFPTKAWEEHRSAEGVWEGSIGGFIALYNLIQTGASQPPSSICLRLITAASSFILALPGGLESALLLHFEKSGLNFHNYYEVSQVRRLFVWPGKYARSAGVIAYIAVIASIRRLEPEFTWHYTWFGVWQRFSSADTESFAPSATDLSGEIKDMMGDILAFELSNITWNQTGLVSSGIGYWYENNYRCPKLIMFAFIGLVFYIYASTMPPPQFLVDRSAERFSKDRDKMLDSMKGVQRIVFLYKEAFLFALARLQYTIQEMIDAPFSGYCRFVAGTIEQSLIILLGYPLAILPVIIQSILDVIDSLHDREDDMTGSSCFAVFAQVFAWLICLVCSYQQFVIIGPTKPGWMRVQAFQTGPSGLNMQVAAAYRKMKSFQSADCVRNP